MIALRGSVRPAEPLGVPVEKPGASAVGESLTAGCPGGATQTWHGKFRL